MKKSGKTHLCNGFFFLLAIGLAAFCLGGCATAGGNEDENASDLPWNTPQPWEGAPSIPGLDGMGR